MVLDLLSTLIQLPKAGTYSALKINNVLYHVTQLLDKYPWNNFLQLYMVSIFEWMLKTPRLTAHERVSLLNDSKLIEVLVKLGSQARYKHEKTQNTTRAGYMGCVIKLANTVKKTTESDSLDSQEHAPSVFTAAWHTFLSTEVEKSNKADTTTLGGASKFQGEDSAEEESAHFDDNMDAIMGRFNTFNSLMNSNNSSQADSIDDKENEEEQPRDLPSMDFVGDYEEEKIYADCEVKLPEAESEEAGDFY